MWSNKFYWIGRVVTRMKRLKSGLPGYRATATALFPNVCCVCKKLKVSELNKCQFWFLKCIQYAMHIDDPTLAILRYRKWRSKIQNTKSQNSCLMFEILLPEALLKFPSILTKTQIFLAINFLSTMLGRIYNFVTEFSH